MATLLEIPIFLYCTQEPRFEGVLSWMKGLFVDPEERDEWDFSSPEVVVLKILKDLGVIKYETRVRFEKNVIDQTFGEYPFLLVGHNFITRENILPFLVESCAFENTLAEEKKEDARFLLRLCFNKFRAALSYYRCMQQHSKEPTYKEAILSPLKTMRKNEDKKFLVPFMSKIFNFSKETDPYQAIVSVLEELNSKISENGFFFADTADKVTLRSLVDIIVYAMLKNLSLVATDLGFLDLLKEGAVLGNFMRRFEDGLFGHRLMLAPSLQAGEKILSLGEKYIHKPMVDYPLGSRIFTKAKEDQKRSWGRIIAKYVFVGSFIGLFTYWNNLEMPNNEPASE